MDELGGTPAQECRRDRRRKAGKVNRGGWEMCFLQRKLLKPILTARPSQALEAGLPSPSSPTCLGNTTSWCDFQTSLWLALALSLNLGCSSCTGEARPAGAEPRLRLVCGQIECLCSLGCMVFLGRWLSLSTLVLLWAVGIVAT